jgi:hypothetical protein
MAIWPPQAIPEFDLRLVYPDIMISAFKIMIDALAQHRIFIMSVTEEYFHPLSFIPS